MTRLSYQTHRGKNATILGALLGSLLVGSVAWAEQPVPFIMTTEIVFPQGSGVFLVHEPAWICPSGTFETLSGSETPPQAGAFVAKAIVEYTCDNGSGSFRLRVHPQVNYGTQGNGFVVSGPWTARPGGTGDYTDLRGQGTLGFDFTGFDDNTGEVFGVESFVGHVQ